MSTQNENGRSFEFSITNGDVYGAAPMLLGRDNPYTLNVKLVDKDGKPVAGVQYSISSTNDGEHLVVLDGMDRTYASSESGNDFYLEGFVAEEDAHLKLMQYAFSVDCVTGEGADQVIGTQAIKMGRLLRWGRPVISVKTGPDRAVFTTKTERVGKESGGAKWNWGQKIDTCTIKIGDSIDGAGATSLTGNPDASFQAAPEIDLSKFSNVSKAKIQFEGGLSSDGFTAVLPFSEDNIELYYFQSVAFSKPSVIVGVPAEVSCKLMGLDKKPRANVDVEWATTFGDVQPKTSNTDAQGVAKTECTAEDAGTATVTVLSKTQRMIRGTTAPVPVGPLLIVDPTASAAQYVVGHSEAITFSVTLKAGGQPVSGLTVEWFIGDTAKGTSTSNGSGKATRDLTFTADQAVKQIVKARVSGTGVQTTFDINVYTAEITDPKATATEYVVGHSPEVTFSIVLKAGGSPLVNADIEWAIDGNKIKDGKTDSNGYASHTTLFERTGNRHIAAKDLKTGKTHSFSLEVVAAKMTDPESSGSEYILKHSSPIKYSVVLEADGKPLVKKRVEWSVGNTTVTRETDDAGRAHFEKSFDAVGDYTINAKDARSTANHSFTTKVFAVEITDPKASATEYVVGYSPEVEFSVVLKANGKPLQGIAVDWSVAGKTTTVSSDAHGKVLFKQGFQTAGSHSITAKVSNSGQSVSFNLRASTLAFDVKWSAQNDASLIPATPDLRFRLHKYTINVRILDQEGTPVEGIRFKLAAEGNPQQNGIHIAGLGVEKVSAREGTNYTLTTEYATSPAELKLTLASTLLREWSHTYKMGWLYEPALAHYSTVIKELTVRYHSVVTTMLNAPRLPFDPIELRIPARGWVGKLLTGAILDAIVAERADPSVTVNNGDKVLSPFHTSKNGYVVLQAGEVVVRSG